MTDISVVPEIAVPPPDTATLMREVRHSGMIIMVLSVLIGVMIIFMIWLHLHTRDFNTEFTQEPWDLWTLTVRFCTARIHVYALGIPFAIGLFQLTGNLNPFNTVLRWLTYFWLLYVWCFYVMLIRML